MDDKYFNRVAKEIHEIIETGVADESTLRQVYLKIKEVARDQRYNSIESVINWYNNGSGIHHNVCDNDLEFIKNTIHNS